MPRIIPLKIPKTVRFEKGMRKIYTLIPTFYFDEMLRKKRLSEPNCGQTVEKLFRACKCAMITP
jgi:hypothetical protein